MNSALLQFAEWLAAQPVSVGLHESFYMYNWIETTHVLTLMVSLGMLAVIDLRMLGVCLTNVPASKIAERLDKPMLIGFTVMLITGVLLFTAIPVRTTQSLWFRIKMILLVAAAINAWLFRSHMIAAAGRGISADAAAPHAHRRGAVAGAVVGRGRHRPLHRLRLVRLRQRQSRLHRLGGRLRGRVAFSGGVHAVGIFRVAGSIGARRVRQGSGGDVRDHRSGASDGPGVAGRHSARAGPALAQCRDA